MRHALRFSLLVLAMSGATLGDEPGATIPADLILERFAVNKGGDALLVPVKIAGKERLFIVDTGCTMTTVDSGLLSGEPRASTMMETPQGLTIIKVHAAPEGSIGRLPLGVDSVLGMELEKFRELSGYPIEGILGMDFLGRHVVHIDFDRGELLFLKSSPKDAGNLLPLHGDQGDIPELDAWFSGARNVRFRVDTGHVRLESGSVESLAIRPKMKGDDFEEIGSTRMHTAGGTRTCPLLRWNLIALGGFSVGRPIFSESSNGSWIGLGFLSRFIVTFDFPGSKLYLRPGKAYERPDLWDLSGLDLVRRNGTVLVEGVDKNSPGFLAGIQAGDVLLTLGTSRADESTLFAIQKALSHDGQVPCSIRRGTERTPPDARPAR